MNYIQIVNRCAIIDLADSNSSGHLEASKDVSALLNMKFKLFLLDFRKVEKFSSHVLGFTLGVIKSVLANSDGGARIFARGLNDMYIEIMQKALTIEDVEQEAIDLYGKGIKEIKIIPMLNKVEGNS